MAVIDEEYDEPGSAEYERPERDLPDFDVIIGAPDLTTLIKRPLTATGREYRDKAASGLRAVMIGSIETGNFADAAAILWHGPGAATAIGGLCAESEWAAKAVDLVTSPSSPLSTCLLALIPLLSQIGRNHEDELRDIPSRFNLSRKARAQRKLAKSEQPKSKPRFTIKIWRWQIPVRLDFGAPGRTFLAGVRSQTQNPVGLAQHVFTDPDVVKQLEKLGILITQGNNNGQQPV